jgi:hypothetical protein
MPQIERDFPIGHPAASDTVIGSAEHHAWLEQHKWVENQRDFPPGHPKAVDTPGNLNSLAWPAGIDPLNPHLEEHTGLTPDKAAAVKEWNLQQAELAKESAALLAIDANVANAALAEERARLEVDTLTAEQHAAVLERLQQQ